MYRITAVTAVAVAVAAVAAAALQAGPATAGGGGRSGTWPASLPLPTAPGSVVAQSSSTAVIRSTDEGNLDRLGERFRGVHMTLVQTNLTPAEREELLETFGSG